MECEHFHRVEELSSNCLHFCSLIQMKTNEEFSSQLINKHLAINFICTMFSANYTIC
ncbi:hypothetical protein ZOSMA_1G03180 [Zostera marina]|uniref:Uncharacterized protein n=1 Tax=Zostera marina TaxID=29655 RepID=A0A0K9PQ35_ZOSMR|nr:hypothetical protein ZOSMA_1G03180 [Zostera marina]